MEYSEFAACFSVTLCVLLFASDERSPIWEGPWERVDLNSLQFRIRALFGIRILIFIMFYVRLYILFI